jgi:hypothetical protein
MNLFTGKELKKRGMAKAVDSAGKDWMEQAYAYSLAFLERLDAQERFMGEQLRQTAEAFGLTAPKSNRVWGAIMIRLAKEKKIKNVGFQKVSNPLAHSANASVWMKI